MHHGISLRLALAHLSDQFCRFAALDCPGADLGNAAGRLRVPTTCEIGEVGSQNSRSVA